MSAGRESNRIARWIAAPIMLALLALVFAGCAKQEATTDQGGGNMQTSPPAAPSAPVNVNVSASAIAQANAPTPPANATKQSQIGQGASAVDASDGPTDSDMSWVQQMDIDGDGTMDDVTAVWDDEDKVMYYYTSGDLTCSGGGTATGDLMVAVYGTGNTDGVPAGSGWYLVTLDASECAVATAGAYGCTFDANGNETACGLADIDETTDDLTIITATQ